MSTISRTIAALAMLLIVCCGSAYGQITDPAVINWSINTTGTTGTSTDTEIDGFVSLILADVETVHYTNNFAFVETSGVPSYNVGPFADNNPAYPSDLDKVYRISRNPVEDTSGNNQVVGAGPIGVLVNGVVIFNFTDARSYNNQGIWNQDANTFELAGFDDALGHPAPIGSGSGPNAPLSAGRYHHHQNPKSLREQLGDDGSGHSPILGFAFDGFPIYGPYAFADATDGSSAIVQIDSSYNLRNISDRTTLADGTVLPEAMYGPTLQEFGLGAYQEDFFFDATNGDLDEHNGRFGVTPEYPSGTYAYFVTLNADGTTSAFPHIIGVSYFGEVTSQTNVSIPALATQYISILLGDVNQDGVVNFLDISPFIGLLSSGSFLAEADVNEDGAVTFLDISPFINILSGN